MAVDEKLIDWLKDLGYHGQIPSSFSKICNPSTAFIWEQLITNVRPRPEVDTIRKNLIISRLTKKSLKDQDEFDYPIKEIHIYGKKKKCEDKVKKFESQIGERESEIEELLKANKLTYAVIDNMKSKIRENLEKKFLLEKKAKMLEEDINQAKEVVTLAKNVTPVEMDANSNCDEITETLQKCAEKLQKLSQQTPKCTFKSNNFSKCFKEETKAKPNRESLGLLRPSDYLSISDDFDLLFLSPKKDNLFASISETSEEFNDTEVQNILKNLLYKNNRLLILKQFGEIHENLIRGVQTPSTVCNALNRFEVNYDDLTQLYFIHAKEELKKDKYRLQLEKLKETEMKRKEEILCQIHGNRSEMFELQTEKVYHKSINFFLDKKINSHRQLDSGTEIYVINSQIKQVKDEITCKIECNENLIRDISKIISDIKTNIKETSICVKKLYPYLCDMSCPNFLTQEVNSQEIETFRKFPLEFNRRFAYSDRNLFYRDVAHTGVPSFLGLDSSEFRGVTSLIDVPFSPPESVISNTLRRKVTLNMLKGLSNETPKLERHNYCFNEEWVENTENQLDSIIHSIAVKQVLAAPSEVRENADLWIEMPLRNFISPRRLVDGQDYKFFEEKLNKMYRR